MGLLSRVVFFEIAVSAALGSALFMLVLFLQKASQLFSILVNSSATTSTVGYIFLLLVPASMPLTVPLGALAGTLIALSRMSNDGEVVGLRAAGIPSRRLAFPVAIFALLATALTGYCTLWLTPWCEDEVVRVVNSVGAQQLTSEIQPRVFDETFPNTILYVSDVLPGQPVHWRGVFLADTTSAEQRKSTAVNRGEGPRITLARDATVSADENQLQLSMQRKSSYEAGPDPVTYYRDTAPRSELVLRSGERGPQKKVKAFSATPTRELFATTNRTVEASIELHRRFALPLACLLLALTGVPLGASSRKGGKSAAFAITVFFAFFYFTVLVALIGLAKDGRLKPALAVWAPNMIFCVLAVVLLARLELPQTGDRMGTIRAWALGAWKRLRKAVQHGDASGWGNALPQAKFFLLPQIIDTYVLASFLYYFGVLLGGFVVLTEVFNFFELLADVFHNGIPMRELLQYLLFLAPKLIYDTAPVSVLVASLVTFGLLSKNNEVVALKACGVSLYRLSVPILLTTLAMSGALFVFDHAVVTRANIIQDGLRNKIKGRPVQTYLNPNRKWIRGHGERIFFYKHFDQDQGMLGGVQIYDVDPRAWRLTRHVLAERAHWEPALKTWIFENGWVREVGLEQDRFQTFAGSVTTFPEIDEPPSWFLKEVKTYKQLNAPQLSDYIAELRQSGFNTVALQVQYHKKFAVPLFVFVMALLSVPFAFMTGSRGTMTGVGVSLGIAVAYFILNYLFEQLGGAGQLPPGVAAWAPDGIFALAGVYLMMRLKT